MPAAGYSLGTSRAEMRGRRQGDEMRRAIRIGFLAAVFGAGYLLGVTTQPTAEAQVGELGKKAMESAAGGGGTLGTVAELGTTIEGLQTNVNELQGHIDTLNKIKGALGGGGSE